MTQRTRLAVLGSPIEHSKSPAIHRAAYSVLGLDWRYDAVEVAGDGLGEFVRGLDASWRGLSLTMPLKRDVLPLLEVRDSTVDVVGAANTMLLTDAGWHGFNTDVTGAVRALREAGVDRVEWARILGSGATATSMLAALAELGARSVTVSARTPEKAAPIVALGELLGVHVEVHRWGMLDRSLRVPDVIVSTVPGGAEGFAFPEEVRRGAVLFEVAYDVARTTLVAEWEQAGGTIVTGLDLLVYQAIGQVRIFLTGDPAAAFPDERVVIGAMRSAL